MTAYYRDGVGPRPKGGGATGSAPSKSATDKTKRHPEKLKGLRSAFLKFFETNRLIEVIFLEISRLKDVISTSPIVITRLSTVPVRRPGGAYSAPAEPLVLAGGRFDCTPATDRPSPTVSVCVGGNNGTANG